MIASASPIMRRRSNFILKEFDRTCDCAVDTSINENSSLWFPKAEDFQLWRPV
jgi:hypothetical protein